MHKKELQIQLGPGAKFR